MSAESQACVGLIREIFSCVPEPWNANFPLTTVLESGKFSALLDSCSPPQVNALHNHFKDNANGLLDAYPDAKKIFPRTEWTLTGNAKLKRIQICDFFSKAGSVVFPSMLSSGPPQAAPSPAKPQPGPPSRSNVQSSPQVQQRPATSAGPAAVASSAPAVVRSGRQDDTLEDYCSTLLHAAPMPWNRLTLGMIREGVSLEDNLSRASVPDVNIMHDYLMKEAGNLLDQYPRVKETRLVSRPDWGGTKNAKLRRIQISDFFKGFADSLDVGAGGENSNNFSDDFPPPQQQRPMTAPPMTHGSQLASGGASPQQQMKFNPTYSPPPAPAAHYPDGKENRSLQHELSSAITASAHSAKGPANPAISEYVRMLFKTAPSPWREINLDLLCDPMKFESVLEAASAGEINGLHLHLKDNSWSLLNTCAAARQLNLFQKVEWTLRGNLRMKRVQIHDYFRPCSLAGGFGGGEEVPMQRPQTAPQSNIRDSQDFQDPPHPQARPQTSAGHPPPQNSGPSGEGPVFDFVSRLFSSAPPPWNQFPIEMIFDPARFVFQLEQCGAPDVNVLHTHMKNTASLTLNQFPAVREQAIFQPTEWTSRGNPQMKRIQITDYFRNCNKSHMASTMKSPARPHTAPAAGRTPQKPNVGGGAAQQQNPTVGTSNTVPFRKDTPLGKFILDLLRQSPPPWSSFGTDLYVSPPHLAHALEHCSSLDLNSLHDFIKDSAWPLLASTHLNAKEFFSKPIWGRGTNARMKRTQLIDFFAPAMDVLKKNPPTVSEAPPPARQEIDDYPAHSVSSSLQFSAAQAQRVLGPPQINSLKSRQPLNSGGDFPEEDMSEDLLILQKATNRIKANLARQQDAQAKALQEEIHTLKQELSRHRKQERKFKNILDHMRRKTDTIEGRVHAIGNLKCVVNNGNPSGPIIVKGPVCVVGRSPSADISIPDPRISNRHIQLLSLSEGVFVECLTDKAVWVIEAGAAEDPRSPPMKKGEKLGPLENGDVIICLRSTQRGHLPASISLLFSRASPEDEEVIKTQNCSLAVGLEGALKCGACANPMIGPVTAGCGHSFCNECVRDHAGEILVSTCPMCSADIRGFVEVAAVSDACAAFADYETWKASWEDSAAGIDDGNSTDEGY